MALTRDQKNALCVHLGYLHFSFNTLLHTIEGLRVAGCLTSEQAEKASGVIAKQREDVCMDIGKIADEEMIALLIDYKLLPSDFKPVAPSLESLPVSGRTH